MVPCLALKPHPRYDAKWTEANLGKTRAQVALDRILFLFFVYFIGGLKCVGHSLVYVAHFVILTDVWNRTQRADVARRRAKNLATISLLSYPSPYFATHLPTSPPISLPSHQSPYLASHFPTQPPISLLIHPSPYLATHLPTQPPISLLSLPSPCIATHLPSQPPIFLLSHPSPYLAAHLPWIENCDSLQKSHTFLRPFYERLFKCLLIQLIFHSTITLQN